MFESFGPNYWWELAIKEQEAGQNEERIRRLVREEIERQLGPIPDRSDTQSTRTSEPKY